MHKRRENLQAAATPTPACKAPLLSPNSLSLSSKTKNSNDDGDDDVDDDGDDNFQT